MAKRTLYLGFHIDIGKPQQPEQHQSLLRLRLTNPMSIPTIMAAAMAPSGLRRPIISSSEVNVLA
jgi:hypothetical protein